MAGGGSAGQGCPRSASVTPSQQPVLLRFVPEERQALAHHLLRALGDRPPDGEAIGEFGGHVNEAFHGQPSVEADGGERRKDLVPGDVAEAGRAAVTFGEVDVSEMVAGGEDAVGAPFSSMFMW